MQLLPVTELVPHPQNDFYFDDITGESWKEFLHSIQTSGVIEPVVIDQNKLIISGHQRVRACKELGITEVMTETRQYDSDDKILKDLIETNLRQRGIGNTNPVKFGRCIQTLERIYGIQHGGDRKSKDNNCLLNKSPKTEQDLADILGVSISSIKNYKQLAVMIPELQSLVESGKVTKTVALGIMKKLSEDEQKELASQIAENPDKVNQRKLDFYINRVKELSDEKDTLTKEKEDLEQQLYAPVTIEKLTADEIDNLKKEFEELSIVNKEETQSTAALEETIKNLRTELAQAKKDAEAIKEQNETLKYDNNHIRLSMNDEDAEVYSNCKALSYASRMDRIVKDELNNLELYGDIENLDTIINNRLDKIAEDLIRRLNDFRRRLYTVDVKEEIIIDIN